MLLVSYVSISDLVQRATDRAEGAVFMNMVLVLSWNKLPQSREKKSLSHTCSLVWFWLRRTPGSAGQCHSPWGQASLGSHIAMVCPVGTSTTDSDMAFFCPKEVFPDGSWGWMILILGACNWGGLALGCYGYFRVFQLIISHLCPQYQQGLNKLRLNPKVSPHNLSRCSPLKSSELYLFQTKPSLLFVFVYVFKIYICLSSITRW